MSQRPVLKRKIFPLSPWERAGVKESCHKIKKACPHPDPLPGGEGIKMGLRGLIRLYRFVLSPYIGQQCRFHPTCSVYAEQALEKHGVLAGLWLASRRILRCNPWSRTGGIDPVPDQFEWRAHFRYKRGSPHRDSNPDSNNETP